MNKEQIYKQIDNFVNKRVGKSKLHEIKFYVDTPTAEDRANFTQWAFYNANILKDKKFNKIIDLCYGSGNLTTHILYESNIDVTNLVLNDKNKNDRNNALEIGAKTDKDFLDADQFQDKYDLIIFNPQIGGTDTYPEGAVEFKKSVEPIIYDGTIEDYLETQSISIDELVIHVNEIKKSIMIHSDILSKSKMREMIGKIEIFNYYDVFYQSKETKVEGFESNIVKFRRTIDKISHANTVIIFLGEESIYQTLFADYPYVLRYLPDDGKQLFILSKDQNKRLCYEYKNKEFIINEICKKVNTSPEEDLEISKYLEDLDDLSKQEDNGIAGYTTEEKNVMTEKEDKQIFSTVHLGNLEFSYKNVLFKGVPGTGKSRAVDNIIKNELDIENQKENILRINIHSASSNADLMQGIGISSTAGKLEYKEKQGLIFNLIKRAVFNPSQPFVLILEEIQENSLNELIGDLIYLIEDDKRAKLKELADDTEYGYKELIDNVVKKTTTIHYVEIPYLVSSSTEYRKMILPDNLYIFCTSNYRDDKKVIEDNLLRRFEVIEIYPKKEIVSEYSKEFFESLNDTIRKVFSYEIHPDRYMIGHAIWKNIDKVEKFYRAFLKVVTEFKDIKEIEFETFQEILNDVKLPNGIDEEILKQQSYYELINMLQTKIGYGFID